MDINDELREGVIALARQAAAAILAVYESSDFAVQEKSDHSPLTAADMAAHRCITAGLQALTPDVPVLSEESKGVDIAERRTWRTLWLVDPLDGTREFIKRNGEFTINIALIEDGVATFGVIQQPVTGGLWHGAAQGAFRREGERDVAIHTRKPSIAPLRVAASRSHRDARTQALLDALPGAEVIGCGSALKFCKLAEGGIDLYPRFGPTSEWDTGAGQAILEAAGGAVLDPHGRPFRYNQRDTLLNGDFIALGDTELRARLPA
ncbi:3'(2'),5'-bisphosphate nucleotidase CysQ [Thermomonas sp.]|uniref:3'(2'),5'-bisphosphate nucleotidase CysQ n=1 Tax=Thermomonas sp. TaxID=1971895 RepID=UPI002B52926F|nr:3'(2'),5'-bisphosphate nucleotidase CysQ [Thermomonas sp.]HRO63081.1 3'(2'),5'-bisphosphate nucleotidase CysQ [Thermomonas sp.]